MTKHALTRRLQNKGSVLLAGLTFIGSLTLASVVQSQGGSAIAQATSSAIPLRNIVQYYSNFPHQNRAIALLQQQIDKNRPELLQTDSIFSNVWRASATLAGHTDILPEIAQSDRTGTDPLSMALAIANPDGRVTPLDIEVLGGESVESIDDVIVTIDAYGVLDDSISAARTRFDMFRQENGQWQIRKAGRQVRCQPGRGHQDWSAELCL